MPDALPVHELTENGHGTNSSHASALDATAVAKIVREELDRSNKYLEFAQRQIAQDRSFYKYLYTWAGGFLALMVALAGIFSYTSVSQMRSDIKASVDAELARGKVQIETAIAESQSTVDRQLADVRTEVQKRLDTEFQSDNIKSLIADAAKARTEKEITGIVRSEVSTQVAQGIKDQGPAIQKVVEDQTKEAVKALQPTIGATVNQVTKDQVTASVMPIQAQIATYGDYIRMGELATLARSDDRQSFDYLIQVALGNKSESKNPELRKLADSTAGAVIADTEGGLHLGRTFKEKQTPESMKKFMTSQNRLEREAALDNYAQDDKTILPLLVNIIRSDESISVVYKATARFNALTKQSFEFWKTTEILDWWNKTQGSFE